MEPQSTSPLNAAPGESAPLLINTLDEAQRLVRLEVLLVKEELRQEAKAMKAATMGFAAAIAFALTGITLLALSGALGTASLGPSLTMGLGIGSFVAAIASAVFAFRKAPKAPLLDEAAAAADGRGEREALRGDVV